MTHKELVKLAKALNETDKLDEKIRVVAIKNEELEKLVAAALVEYEGADAKGFKKLVKDKEVKALYDSAEEEEEEDDFSEETMAAAKALEVEPEEDETEKDFIRRICLEIDKLDDDGWGAMSEAVQDWGNARNEEFKAEKAAAKKTDKKSTTKKDGDKKKESKPKTAVKKGAEWKEGSATQKIFGIIKKAGKKGIKIETALKKAVEMMDDLKIKTEARCKQKTTNVFAAAVEKEIAEKDGDKYTYTPKD